MNIVGHHSHTTVIASQVSSSDSLGDKDSMSFLELTSIRKQYDDVVAVNDISLEVKEGEFLSILGPSGSGKTTTLNLIAGFENATDGDITVAGDSIVDLPPEERDMGMIFQDLALFPHMTVAENVSFGLEYQTDLSDSEIEEKVANALKMVELPGYQDRNINNLSGGEQQRVALARAVVIEPEVLLYDEPLSDLDRQLRESMRREIQELHDELGITSIYVTHNQREALTLSDRIAVMRDGDIAQVATPNELYEEPADSFVADFVGDANLLEGSIVEKGGQTQFKTSFLSLNLNGAFEGGRHDSMLLVRPEDLRLEPAENADNEGDLVGRIENIDHLESLSQYSVAIEDDHELIVSELGSPRFRTGDEVTVSFVDYSLVGRAD